MRFFWKTYMEHKFWFGLMVLVLFAAIGAGAVKFVTSLSPASDSAKNSVIKSGYSPPVAPVDGGTRTTRHPAPVRTRRHHHVVTPSPSHRIYTYSPSPAPATRTPSPTVTPTHTVTVTPTPTTVTPTVTTPTVTVTPTVTTTTAAPTGSPT